MTVRLHWHHHHANMIYTEGVREKWRERVLVNAISKLTNSLVCLLKHNLSSCVSILSDCSIDRIRNSEQKMCMLLIPSLFYENLSVHIRLGHSIHNKYLLYINTYLFSIANKLIIYYFIVIKWSPLWLDLSIVTLNYYSTHVYHIFTDLETRLKMEQSVIIERQ